MTPLLMLRRLYRLPMRHLGWGSAPGGKSGGGNRGATSVLFGLSAVSLLGFAGLASEGGTWYLQQRQAQNAADSAAMFAALALSNTGTVGDAANVATLNGFTTGASGGATTSVAANPLASGAVEVDVTLTEPPLLSGLFLSNNITISTRSVAQPVPNGSQACVLSLQKTGTLTVDSGANVYTNGCVLASNGTGASSLALNGSTITALSLQASGSCTGNNNCAQNVTLQRPVSAYQPQTPDPYAAVFQSFSAPTACTPLPSTPVTLLPTGTSQAYCTPLSVGSGTVELLPGTYVFKNAGISVTGGTLQCTACAVDGVTIILTGDPTSVGSIDISGGTVKLQGNSGFGGVLFYRDSAAQTGTVGLDISPSATVQLAGGLYFPSSLVNFSGNTTNGTSAATTCLVLVAEQVTITGSSGFDSSGCRAAGTQLAQLQSIRVVE